MITKFAIFATFACLYTKLLWLYIKFVKLSVYGGSFAISWLFETNIQLYDISYRTKKQAFVHYCILLCEWRRVTSRTSVMSVIIITNHKWAVAGEITTEWEKIGSKLSEQYVWLWLIGCLTNISSYCACLSFQRAVRCLRFKVSRWLIRRYCIDVCDSRMKIIIFGEGIHFLV